MDCVCHDTFREALPFQAIRHKLHIGSARDRASRLVLSLAVSYAVKDIRVTHLLSHWPNKYTFLNERKWRHIGYMQPDSSKMHIAHAGANQT